MRQQKKYSFVFCLLTVQLTFASLMAQDAIDIKEPSYVRRHIIICIDQTMQDPDKDAPKIYETLVAMLLGKEMPSNIPTRAKYLYKGGYIFDPYQDEISVFISKGINGSGNPMSGDWERINNYAIRGQISADRMNDIIDSSVIQYVSSFRTSGLSEVDFINNIIKPLFSLPSYYGSRVRMSSITYPMILSHIVKTPATEIVLLLVSDFKGGGGSELDKGDDKNIYSLLGKTNSKRYYESFWDHIHEIEKPFTFNRTMLEVDYSTNGYKSSPKIMGGELVPNAFDGTSFDPYPFHIIQKKWNGNKYEISGAQMHVSDNSQIQISRIDIEITDSNGVLKYCYSFNDNIESLKKGNIIQLKDFIVDFDDNVANEINSYLYSYVVYTDIVDEKGHGIIPIVKKKYIIPNIKMATAPRPWLPPFLIGLFIVMSCVAMRLIYVYRGKKNIPNIDIDVIPISNTRYMEVKDCEVKNYDCWYVEDEKDRLRKIRFRLDLTSKKIRFAQKRRFSIKYQVEDLDHNDKFTFKPAGKADDGTDKQLNELYPLSPIFDMTKSASYKSDIDVDAYIDTGDQIDFDIDNVLEMKLTVSLFINEKGIERKVDSNHKYYKFIAKPKLRNSNVWAAFDAGTSGATIAYGITGNWLDQNEIKLVRYDTQEAGTAEIKQSAIFPSVIAIPDESKAFVAPSFNAEDYAEDDDFVFGEDAEKESYNKFQSIKKFLGYKSPQLIKQRNGDNDGTITGQDLAHLLVKGMYSRLEKDIEQNKNEDVRKQFYNEDVFEPQRAVVAVPNNYTLNKVQDMVNSVERLKKFKEVHFLYESEGVMMTYLRKSLPILKDKQNRTFVVFDMGGATINVTAFGLTLRFGKNDNIHKIKLTSLAKIGYFVGGDDIDFALIQFLYSIPSVKDAISELIRNDKTDNSTIVSQEDVLEHQKKHKNDLIDFARKIKLDWIDVQNGETKSDNIMVSTEVFWMYLRNRISDIVDIELPVEPTEKDIEFISEEKRTRSIMKEYVLANISDALIELKKSPHFPSNTHIELILSGRSVLYPGVKETILKSFKGRNVSLWDGFYKEGTELFDDQKVKTAVAEGACWYAMYSRDIELQHNYITSSYGFEDRSNNQKSYHELIKNGSEFEDDGCCRGEVVNDELFDPNINDVKFLQMMGADADDVVKKDIRHKKNLLDEIKPDQIKTAIEKINFVVDEKGNYSYEVYLRGFEEPITRESTRAYRQDKDIQNEIKDENSPAYEFATINPSMYTPIGTDQETSLDSGLGSNQNSKPRKRIK